MSFFSCFSAATLNLILKIHFISTVDTVDWRPERSAQNILDSVLPNLKSGSIILCHNNGYMIKDYLPTLLKTAIDQGYQFVTVGELLLDGDTIIDVNGVQKPA
jgi:peptidoglycan/xylan/chitin deacetylase (PgdA/CDA1 family)